MRTHKDKGNKMSKAKLAKYPDPKIYQSSLDPDQRGFVNASIASAIETLTAQFLDEIKSLRSRIVYLTNENDRISNELAIVKSYYEVDPRYLLTKAKIVYFLKKQGIE